VLGLNNPSRRNVPCTNGLDHFGGDGKLNRPKQGPFKAEKNDWDGDKSEIVN